MQGADFSVFISFLRRYCRSLLTFYLFHFHSICSGSIRHRVGFLLPRVFFWFEFVISTSTISYLSFSCSPHQFGLF